MENAASLGPNVVSFLLTSGARQCYVVGAYMLLNNMPSMHHVEQALRAASKGSDMILMGDLNTCLGNPCEEC